MLRSLVGRAIVNFFKRTFHAMDSRNYRLWFIGQLVSLFGTWMQITAQGFLVFELTHSPAQLGIVAFAAGVPTWIFMLYGGIVADRMSKRTLLIWTQTALMTSAMVLALLVFTHVVQPWQITLLAFVTGIATAFDAPTRQSFTIELVQRNDLANAIALNSTMFNGASVVGPAIAGVTYAAWGPGWCFLLNAISFLSIIIALALMRDMPAVRQGTNKTLAQLVEGLRYVLHEPTILPIIFMIAMTGLFGLSYTTLLPAWAHKILHGDARTLGYLQSLRGLGAMSGALAIASLGHVINKRRTLFAAAFIVPLFLILFAFSSEILEALAALFFVGASMMFIMNLANATVQTTVVDELRGRVMSVYTLMFFGTAPLGGLLVGSIAEVFGERVAVVTCACGLASSALIMTRWITHRAAPNQGPTSSESNAA